MEHFGASASSRYFNSFPFLRAQAKPAVRRSKRKPVPKFKYIGIPVQKLRKRTKLRPTSTNTKKKTNGRCAVSSNIANVQKTSKLAMVKANSVA